MGLRISTNVAALTANRNMSRVSEALARNYNHLATGSRIASASDDAAGVGISARLRARVRSLDQASRNAQDGMSLLQTVDGALSEIEGTLIRMRELAVQSGNGTLSSEDRTALDLEFEQLKDSIDALADSTEFNGTALMNDVSLVKTFQVGADTTADVDTLVVTMVDAKTDATLMGIDGTNIGALGDVTTAISLIDDAINTVGDFRSKMGAATNRLETTLSALQVRSENLSAANSRIQDVDVASETAALTKNSILQQAAISVLAQANVQPQAALSLLG